MTDPLTYLQYPFTQRAIADLLLLALIAGALGPWIVMRSLAFFAHAVGTAAFPGLVIAAAAGVPLPIGAAAGAAATTVGAGLTSGTDRNAARTGLWLSGSLAAGAIAAGALGSSGAAIDSALFGSLLTLSAVDLALAGILAAGSLIAAVLGGPRWLAAGLLGRRSHAAETALVLLVAAATIGQLAAAGALLATTLLVLPAVATRPWIRSVGRWQVATLLLAAAVGLGGLALALAADLPPGAAIAVLSGVAAGASLAATTLRPTTARALSAVAAISVVAGGCAGAKPPPTSTAPADEAPTVVATTPVIASLVEAVGGARVTVRTIVPKGADPHDFEPRPSDMAAVSGSSLVFANGGLDEWIEQVRGRAGGSTRLVELIDRVPVRLEGAHDHDEAGTRDAHDHGDGPDPHWFHDPRNVAAAAKAIATELSRIAPSDARAFAAGATRLGATARDLERAGRSCIAKLPANRRALVTDHEAFAYLANRTGLKVVGTVIPSTSDSATASARHLEELATTIEALGIPAIFPESALDPKTADALARRTGVSSDLQLDADTLGPAGSGREDWAGMWATNVGNIALGLSGGTVRCGLRASPPR